MLHLNGFEFTGGHEDHRRKIEEGMLPNGTTFQRFMIKERLPLGNHYHTEEKLEIFSIISGGGVFAFVPVDQKGVWQGLPERIEVSPGYVIYVPAFLAHAFVLQPGSQMTCWTNTPNPDIHPCNHLL
jgi:mannose-6-phosphate isomerase-like protein (cupin superfamily)